MPQHSRCEWCPDSLAPTRMVGSLEVNTGPGIGVYACEACRERYGLKVVEKDPEPEGRR
ncbi:hypothetical protein ACFW88_00415 [Streptomyces anandii]|uniref:Small CPxCG-related zinc finger protein n=1 Tax=Streptomyces anandii TaxID=285454 RepID=A0ABW6GYB6_9ACTN